METSELAKAVVLLAVIGFGVWLVEQAPISKIFIRAIQFASILFVFLYILRMFGYA